MNKQVSLIGIFSLAAVAFTILFLSNSCKKSDDCPAGYEGDNCDIKTITKFLGDWKATEVCDQGTGGLFITIEPVASEVTQIQIESLAGSIPVTAEVNGNTFTVDGTFESKYYFKGTGTITGDGKTISVSYMEDDQYYNFSCSGTWTKQ